MQPRGRKLLLRAVTGAGSKALFGALAGVLDAPDIRRALWRLYIFFIFLCKLIEIKTVPLYNNLNPNKMALRFIIKEDLFSWRAALTDMTSGKPSKLILKFALR